MCPSLHFNEKGVWWAFAGGTEFSNKKEKPYSAISVSIRSIEGLIGLKYVYEFSLSKNYGGAQWSKKKKVGKKSLLYFIMTSKHKKKNI